jgi:hypothetical protein
MRLREHMPKRHLFWKERKSIGLRVIDSIVDVIDGIFIPYNEHENLQFVMSKIPI